MTDMDQETQPEAGPPPGEDDVEGHNFGSMNPTIARELARAREQDIERDMARRRRQDPAEGESRGSLMGAIRRARRRGR